MVMLKALDELEKFVTVFSDMDFPNDARLDALEGELKVIVALFKTEADPNSVLATVTDMNDRLHRIENMVETVAEEVGPIVAELANSPMIRMLTGGKKRVDTP